METTTQYEPDTFAGFAPPVENWSKLPHEFIDALSLIETIGEMKVILYVLRHTWGYHDEEKKITLDEFCNGRKRRDGTRLDNGTGLSKPTVIDGIERAVKHGFLEVDTDERDKGRVKKFYRLTSSDVKKLDTSSKNPLQRSEKETIEKNSDISADADKKSAPIKKWTHEDVQYIEMVDPGDREYTCSECDHRFDVYTLLNSGAVCYQCGRPIWVTDWNKNNRFKMPPLGLRKPKPKRNPWMAKPVQAWCALASKDYSALGKGTVIKLAQIFKQVGAITDRNAAQVADGILRFPHAYEYWKSYDWPNDGFVNRLGMLLTPDAEPEPSPTPQPEPVFVVPDWIGQ